MMMIPGPLIRFKFKRTPRETTFTVSLSFLLMPFL